MQNDGISELCPRLGPVARIRALGVIAASVVFGVALLPLRTNLAVGLWTSLNVLLGLYGLLSALRSGRVIWQQKQMIMRAAVTGAIGAVVIAAPQILNDGASMQALQAFTEIFAFLAIVLLLSIFSVAGVFLGMAGAGLGLVFSPHPDRAAAAREGVGRIWVAAVTCGAGVLVVSTMAPREAITIGLAIPSFAAALLGISRAPGWDPVALVERIQKRVTRRLTLVRRRPGQTSRTELRGLLTGVIIATAVEALTLLHFLAPLQRVALMRAVALRDSLLPSVIAFLPGMGRTQLIERSSPDPGIVLLRFNSETLRQTFTTGSEAATQARVIDRLHSWHVSKIVLWAPALQEDPRSRVFLVGGLPSHLGPPEHIEFLAYRRMPAVDRQEVVRSIAALPRLTSAMRSAGNVVLVESAATASLTDPALRDDIADLEAVSSYVATDHLEPDSATKIPGIPVAPWTEARGHRSRKSVEEVAAVPDAWKRAVGDAHSGVVLVDSGSRSGENLPEVSCQDVLNAAPIFVSSLGRAVGIWVPPAQYFKGKTVFLDALQLPLLSTLSGEEVSTVASAAATAAIDRGDLIRRTSVWFLLLWIGLAALTGHRWLQKGPLVAAWEAAAFSFLLVIVTGLMSVFQDRWLDPVLPAVIFLAVAVTVSQMQLSSEQREREQNRLMLEQFVSRQLLEELLDDPEDGLGLGGRRQSVCVLFADARSFTAYSERHSPEEVIEVNNAYLTAMTDVLFLHGGVLDKYTGDGLMAFFPISKTQFSTTQQSRAESEAICRAVIAALAMRDAADEVSRRIQPAGREALSIGIGMHYGEAIVGLVGNPRHVNFTAMGSTVNVAHRLQSLASGGEVIISEELARATQGVFQVQEGEPIQVKGIARPVRPCRVIALAEQVTSDGGLS